MNRRDLFAKGAMALAGVALMPLGKLLGQPRQELVSELMAKEYGTTPLIEAARMAEKSHRELFESMGRQLDQMKVNVKEVSVTAEDRKYTINIK